MEITLEEIQKKFESLPEDLKWAIMGANVDDKIIEIGQANNLNVAQMGQLSLETHMVMFGFVHPDKFEDSVKISLGLPEDKIKIIVNQVNEKILKEIREQVLSMYKSGEEKEDENKHEEEDEIMKNAGIEIKRNGSIKTNTVVSNKLLDSVKIPVTHTNHSLTNITPSSNNTQTMPEVKKTSYETNKDPYRLSPDE